MVNIPFWNREGYVRSTIHIFVTCHARILPLWLGGSVNFPILVCWMISWNSVVIPQRVSYQHFLVVFMDNGYKPTLILAQRMGVSRLKPHYIAFMVLTVQR